MIDYILNQKKANMLHLPTKNACLQSVYLSWFINQQVIIFKFKLNDPVVNSWNTSLLFNFFFWFLFIYNSKTTYACKLEGAYVAKSITQFNGKTSPAKKT